MDYNSTLQWLQQLLGSQQGIDQSQFGQGLGLQSQALSNQNEQFNENLGLETNALNQSGSEFNANLALQNVIADWQNQLAVRAQTQSEQGQQFGQNFATKQYADTRSGSTPGMIASELAVRPNAASDTYVKDFLARFAPKQPVNFTPATY